MRWRPRPCWPWARPPRGAPRRWCAGSTGARQVRPAAALVRPKARGPVPMSRAGSAAGTYVALSGGSRRRQARRSGWRSCCGERLAIVVNTGDDFEHLGLHISPDVDTALYTLAGLVNDETGWGRRDETWTFMRALGELGGPTWFKLGDGDLATHVDRTQRLRAGETLTGIGAHQAAALGIAARILPMTRRPRCARWWRPIRARSASRNTSCASSAGRRCATSASMAPARREPTGAGARGPVGAGPRRHHHLPVEPVAQRRSDPGRARACARPCGPAARRSSRYRPSSPARR